MGSKLSPERLLEAKVSILVQIKAEKGFMYSSENEVILVVQKFWPLN